MPPSSWSKSDRLDISPFAFELYFRDGVKRHPHLLEPCRHGFLAGSFHDADSFAFSEVGKAAITFDGRILLRRLRELFELVGGEFPRRNCVCAHEFCHNASFAFCLFSRNVRRTTLVSLVG